MVLLVIVAWAIGIYNRLVTLRVRVDNSWAQIDVQLKRRYDLIPNLVETVKGYAGHEKSTFENVTKARSMAMQATGPAERAQAALAAINSVRGAGGVKVDHGAVPQGEWCRDYTPGPSARFRLF